MTLKNLLLCAVISVSTAAGLRAQIPYINSKELLDLGIKFHDEGQYKKAIEYYKMIPDGDTNYISAVYEQSVSFLADSGFRQSIDIARYGLTLPRNASKRQLLLNIASAYDYLGKTDSAMMVYDSVAALYPLDNQPFYEKGVLHFRKKEYDAAIRYFQQSHIYNPFHFNSSYMMGISYALQGRLSESMIILEGALYHTTNADLAKKVINILSEIARVGDEIDKAYKKKEKKHKHPLFDEIDEIIAAKLVFNKDYKLKSDLDDNITRQTQAILEKLSYKENDTNFVMQYYVPLLAKVYKDDLFEPYILNLFSGYGITQVENKLKKSKNSIGEVSKLIQDYIYKLYSTRTLNYVARQSATEHYYYYNLRTIIEGRLKDRVNMTYEEGPVSMYENHHLLVKGAYDKSGKKTGKWERYYDNGVLKEETFYKNGLETGEQKEYAASSALRKIYEYGEDGKIKEERNYTKEGILDDVQKLLPGGDIEYTSYYANGRTEVKLIVKKGEIKDGPYIYYYDNGRVKKEVVAKNGKFNGMLKEYFENGTLSNEGIVENGEREGIHTTYFDNGKIDNKYTYRKGVLNGPYQEYMEDGTLVSSGTYNNGKLNGTQQNYTTDGALYSTIVFDNEKPLSIKYTLKDGTPVYQKEDSRGLLQYEHYFSNGNKKSSVTLNKNGEGEGLLTYYYFTGSLWKKVNYKDGKLDGVTTTYYKNGEKYDETTYKADLKDGYYKGYFPNGALQSEGWYKDDKRQGPWKYYNVAGKPDNETYYIDDEVNGYVKDYNINGELLYKEIYEDGMLTGTTQYDTMGNAYGTEYFPLTQCKYNIYTPQNKQYYSCEMNYGMLHGKLVKTYPNGKLREVGQFAYGKKDSASTAYYSNGKISGTGRYKKNRKDGEWTYYNELGELKSIQHYKDGEEEGIFKIYANNELRYLDSFRNGNKDGKQYVYGDEGKVAGVLIFDRGDLVSYTYEGKDGKLLPEIPVVNGTAKINTLYANGQKALVYNIKENSYEGTQLLYYSNGQLADERNFKDQRANGPYKSFYTTGKPSYEATYKNDVLQGTEQVFDKNGNVVILKNYYYGYTHGIATITDPETKKAVTETYRYGVLQ